MRGCHRCAEMEKRLEQAALEHWNAIHQSQSTGSHEQDAEAMVRLIATTKAAMDEAQKLYDGHLATAHPESKTE